MNNKQKKLFSYLYSPAKKENKKIIKKSDDNNNDVTIEYVTKKTFKEIEKEIEAHNSSSTNDKNYKKINIEGYTRLGKQTDNADSLLKVEYENTSQKKEIIDYAVKDKRKFYQGIKGYIYTKEENKFIVLVRSYLIPLILIILLLLGISTYSIIKCNFSIPKDIVDTFIPDIDEHINNKNDVSADEDKGGIKIEGFSKWTVPAGQTENIPIPLKNPEGNPCYFTYEIVLNETLETLYKSKMIPPGESINQITLNRALAAGEYNVTIYIYTNELNTGSEMNSAKLDVKLKVT